MTTFIEFETLERPASPNTFLMAPAGLCRKAASDSDSPVFDIAPEALYDRVRELVDTESGWQLKGEAGDDRALAFVAVTPLLRFKDDVDVRVVDMPGDPGSSQLAVYSRSRIGYSDLGANARRVRTLVAKLGGDELPT